ncbi:MAG TPA: hypothetical protein VMY99_05030 [Nevskiaceae bacterium]|nr:hypothetical protein [Nevskiaceae bacterium]
MEEFTKPKHSSTPKKNNTGKLIGGAAAMLLLVVISFFGGVQYQKGHQKTTDTATTGQFSTPGMGGGPGGRFTSDTRDFGTVTAISSTSITLQNPRTSSSKTYNITSSTTITNNGAAATYNDIKTGDTVMVTKADSTSTDATRIMLNPSFGAPDEADTPTTITN